MAARNLARVYVSVTTLDRRLARTLEPRAAAPQRRLATIRALAQAGVPVGVMVAPIIPQLNDRDLEAILEAAAAAGARHAGWVLLRLPREVAPLFRDWLDAHHPLRARARDEPGAAAARRPRQRPALRRADARQRRPTPT